MDKKEMTAKEYMDYYTKTGVQVTDSSKQHMMSDPYSNLSGSVNISGATIVDMGSVGNTTKSSRVGSTSPWHTSTHPYTTTASYTAGYETYRTPFTAETLELRIGLEEVIVSTKHKIIYLHKKGLSISEEVSTLHTFYKGRGYTIIFLEDLAIKYNNGTAEIKSKEGKGIMEQIKQSNTAAYSGFSQKHLDSMLDELVNYKTEVKKAGK